MTQQIKIKLTTYFSLFDKDSKETWSALIGQQVRHVTYGYGVIDEVQDDCLWIKFDTPEEGKDRNYFTLKGFLDSQYFTEISVPMEQISLKKQIQRAERNRFFLEQRDQEQLELAQKLQRQKEREQRELERKIQWQKEEENRQKLLKQKEIEREKIDREQREQREQRELEQKLRQQKEKEDRENLLKQISKKMEEDFLASDLFYSNHPSYHLLHNTEYLRIKANFVKDWCKHHSLMVDDEQAAAIADTNGDIQVIARAGSGKTRTLVTRAIFLQQHCSIAPNELLLLAFNTKAVEEIQNRIKNATGKVPHVMTFHALAHAIVHPEEEIIYDNDSAFQMKLSREIQEVIDDYIRSPQSHNLIRDIMLTHFRDDWEKIIKGNYHISIEERQKLPYESLNGDHVKSFGEKTIANILFENSVAYKYERNFRWSGMNYRPDFTILLGKDQGVVIEYFGLQGERDYDEMSEQKRKFWKSKPNWRFLEYSPSDIVQFGVETFERRLIDDLNELGIPTRKRTDEEIWDLVQHRVIDTFTKAVRSFVSRCRKLNLSPSELERKIKTHSMLSESERLFLNAALLIYGGYIQKLEANKQEDFDGLMWRSVEMVNAGVSRFTRNKGREQGNFEKIKFILIDEFQDFSEMFYQLCMAIRKQNPAVQFFCVGDDWQAINEFAGSELRFFRNFSSYFSNTKQYHISGNYRSPYSIVQVGNTLMQGLGNPATAKKQTQGDVFLCLLNDLHPSTIEEANRNGDEITPAILRIINNYLSKGREIVMLSRSNNLPWFINYSEKPGNNSERLQKFREHIASFFPEADRKSIQISSTHKYKGNEKAVVIVLDAVERRYPLIHQNWIFLHIFGESIPNIEAAEKRLFYVAITRPEETLLIITEKNQISPYIKDIEKLSSIKRIDWKNYPPPPSLSSTSEQIEVRVKSAFNVKEHLKKLDYKYNSSDKSWSRTFPKEGFIFENLLQQNWVNETVEISVYSETQNLIHEYRRKK